MHLKAQVEISQYVTTGGACEGREWAFLEFKTEATEEQVTEFHAWFTVCRFLEESALFRKTVADTLASLPGEKVEGDPLVVAAQKIFEMKSLVARDQKYFETQRKLRQKDVQIANDTRRVALLEKKAALAEDAKKITRRPKPTLAEQEAHMREVFGLPNLEKVT